MNQWIIDNAGIVELIKLLLAIAGLAALLFGAAQLAVRRRAHLYDIYRHIFAMMDEGLREPRHYVYSLDGKDGKGGSRTETFETEQWTCNAKDQMNGDAEKVNLWWKHRCHAECVCRAFDQLGLLVREGRVPLNLIAHFYVHPILKCWYLLLPYICIVRTKRDQPGHMWEFRNLVHSIVIPGLESGKGVWRGQLEHDLPDKSLLEKIKKAPESPRDSAYAPGSHTWTIGRWFTIWLW